MKFRMLTLLLVILAAAAPTSIASADGIIIPQPPICEPCPPPPCPYPLPCPLPTPMTQLAIRYHHVQVSIDDQVATTHIDQVFYNPNDWQVEGVYLFPIPPGAAISSFILWMDGEPVEGRVLPAEQASQQYWEIVNSLRDPALLEYLGQGALQARIFPIPAQGERRIELEYVQTLGAENGLVEYVYPLNTEKFSIYPLEQVSISVEVHSSQAIRAVYSPSHPVDIQRTSANQVQAGYEASQVTPDKDFALYYSTGTDQALHLLTYREPGAGADEAGYFLLLLAPALNAEVEPLPKEIILVLDRSGSMEGEKFRQAQAALRFILEHLNPQDRFNLLAFSTTIQAFSPELNPVNAVPAALRWVDSLSAQGSTDINRALLEAAEMFSGERTSYVIFLTDGLPTEGVVDSQLILDHLAQAAPEEMRLFSFGVGYDVDTFLLDSLAQAHHGTNTYVLPEERIDETVSAFYQKISTPVLTNLQLDFGSIAVFDQYPEPLPDLFSGSQILLTGRYRGGGATSITLRGNQGGQAQEYIFPEQRFSQDPQIERKSLASLPKLWATRKIGYLLSQIRLNGPDPETVEQIVKLSLRYGVITPYTSYLVSEQAPFGSAAQEEIARQQYNQMQGAPAAPVSGQAAVEKSALESAMSQAESAPAAGEETQQMLRSAGSHIYLLQDGKWIDTAFDPEKMEPVRIEFLSEEYHRLVSTNQELAIAFALGSQVIAVSGETAYEVSVTAENVAKPFATVQAKPSQRTETTPAAQATARPLPATSLPSPAAASSGQMKTPICPGGLIVIGILLGVKWLIKR